MQPEPTPFSNVAFLRKIFDAIPAMLLVVDADVRIHHLNDTASQNLGLDLEKVRNKRGGDTLHCVHSVELPEGCGHGAACRNCVIRNSVNLARQGGKVYRKGTRMVLKDEENTMDLHLLISASALPWEGEDFVLLTLENVTELLQLRNLLPICMHCKKIRDDAGYWNEVADYLHKRLDVDFSHGICPQCLEKFYPLKH